MIQTPANRNRFFNPNVQIVFRDQFTFFLITFSESIYIKFSHQFNVMFIIQNRSVSFYAKFRVSQCNGFQSIICLLPITHIINHVLSIIYLSIIFMIPRAPV